MIALSIAIGLPMLLAVIAAWHCMLRFLGRRDAMESFREEAMRYQDALDVQRLEDVKRIDAFEARIREAEERAAELASVAREARLAKGLGKRG